MAKQTDPETARKRAWLSRYKESLVEQKRLAETLQELRSRSTSISAPLPGARSAPTGFHSDRVANSVQQIADTEQRLQAEQIRGADVAAEIINAAFTQLPLNHAQVLVFQYIDLLNADQTARKINLCKNTVMGYRSAALAALKLPEGSTIPPSEI